MIDICIVEDNINDSALLKQCVEDFAKNNKIDVHITVYGDAIKFLEGYKKCDVVFMDIQLPYFDGMHAAQKLREIDSEVVLVFVTTMAQFAIKGYSVNALDFVVKPVSSAVIASKMKRIIKAVEQNEVKTIAFSFDGNVRQVPIASIKYFDTNGHKLIVHLKDGDDLCVRKSLAEYEQLLSQPPYYFLRCNHFYLVNPRYVDRVEGNMLYMGEECLQISRAKLKPFMEAFAKFVGQGI